MWGKTPIWSESNVTSFQFLPPKRLGVLAGNIAECWTFLIQKLVSVKNSYFFTKKFLKMKEFHLSSNLFCSLSLSLFSSIDHKKEVWVEGFFNVIFQPSANGFDLSNYEMKNSWTLFWPRFELARLYYKILAM